MTEDLQVKACGPSCPLFRKYSGDKSKTFKVFGQCLAFKEARGKVRPKLIKESDFKTENYCFPDFCPIDQCDEMGISLGK